MYVCMYVCTWRDLRWNEHGLQSRISESIKLDTADRPEIKAHEIHNTYIHTYIHTYNESTFLRGDSDGGQMAAAVERERRYRYQ